MKIKPNTLYCNPVSGNIYITDQDCNGISLLSPEHRIGAHTFGWKKHQWGSSETDRIEIGSNEDLRKALIDKIKKT